jgi:hypothetical protein
MPQSSMMFLPPIVICVGANAFILTRPVETELRIERKLIRPASQGFPTSLAQHLLSFCVADCGSRDSFPEPLPCEETRAIVSPPLHSARVFSAAARAGKLMGQPSAESARIPPRSVGGSFGGISSDLGEGFRRSHKNAALSHVLPRAERHHLDLRHGPPRAVPCSSPAPAGTSKSNRGCALMS